MEHIFARQYDENCKIILSEKSILGWLLNKCVDEFRDVPPLEIAEHCIEGTPEVGIISVAPSGKIHVENSEDRSQGEGVVFYDVRFTATAPSDKKPKRKLKNYF